MTHRGPKGAPAIGVAVAFKSTSFAPSAIIPNLMHWRTNPKLTGLFLPNHPDDLQVVIHDGGPRITSRRAEAVWVTVTGEESDVFTGRVLNQPTQLQSVRQGQQIRFVMSAGSPHPVLITDKYLRERPSWRIHPCQKCGFSELFDAPSDLIRVVFPNVPEGAIMDAFTSFCPLCGGVQMLEFADSGDESGPLPPQKTKPWWKIW